MEKYDRRQTSKFAVKLLILLNSKKIYYIEMKIQMFANLSIYIDVL